ncbi:uncharacterized protein LOC126879756 isoform X1 [Diabrotica virgifera virgifera]|uniref:Uncharacterized protein n=1 Tax=Diabrotica virgifera virgifera TaxID=50390 RepID=A0ABM5JLY9_DIAVI|nr:uncharacterized protein LOC126879756 isoform X1 [Diabrotica virgifera virgifera]
MEFVYGMPTVNRSDVHPLQKFGQYFWSNSYGSGVYIPRKENTEWSPLILIPLLATVVLIVTVFLLMMFRQNPTFVISTVACCLIFVTVYLIMVAMDSSRQYLY